VPEVPGTGIGATPSGEPHGGLVSVIGVVGDTLESVGPQARAALAESSVVAGGERHLDIWRDWRRAQDVGKVQEVREIAMSDDAGTFARAVAAAARNCGPDGLVAVLASGDPGFFGVLRSLCAAMDRERIRVFPAPSSVSVAFARLRVPWDDAVVVSAHGRPLADAVAAARVAPKSAILTSPDHPPEAVGKALMEAGARPDLVAVCSRLGCGDESVIELDLPALANGAFDPLSVVIVVGPGGLQALGYSPSGTTARQNHLGSGQSARPGRVLAWGLPESAFLHRDGMVTKSEVRATSLGKLELPATGVLWDLGAGSASVAIECASLRPALTVFAIESDPEQASRAATNASAHGVAVHVIEGRAPEVLERLPDPDRVFVGGGGIEVLEAAIDRLRPGGRIVATFAAIDRAAVAAELLGSLVQLTAARGRRLESGGWRLDAGNPVFVAWGPSGSSPETREDHARGTSAE